MHSRAALAFILITVMIDAIGIGIIFPVMPDLIEGVTGGDLSEAALWGGLLATSFAVMQFLFGPLVGNLSDQIGRRPIMLAGISRPASSRNASRVSVLTWSSIQAWASSCRAVVLAASAHRSQASPTQMAVWKHRVTSRSAISPTMASHLSVR